VALRRRDRVIKTPDELLGRQTELKGQRRILLIGRDSHKAIKDTRYKIFTGLTHGTIKVPRDPNAGPKDERYTTSPTFSDLLLRGN
jgi:hypothetical protein